MDNGNDPLARVPCLQIFDEKHDSNKQWPNVHCIQSNVRRKATICWNNVFHQKFPNMECGWAGHYHYPLQLQLIFIEVNNSCMATGWSVFVSCTSSKCNAASYKRKYSQLYYNINYIATYRGSYTVQNCSPSSSPTIQLFLKLLFMKFTE